jgi:hypothetical protein
MRSEISWSGMFIEAAPNVLNNLLNCNWLICMLEELHASESWIERRSVSYRPCPELHFSEKIMHVTLET